MRMPEEEQDNSILGSTYNLECSNFKSNVTTKLKTLNHKMLTIQIIPCIFYILFSRFTLAHSNHFVSKMNLTDILSIGDERGEHGFNFKEEQLVKHIDRGPYFDTTATKNVTSLVGKTGHLNCRIKNLGNKTVSWIRHRDLHLLTVSESTYTSDQRFSAIYNKQSGDWSLQIKYPQLRDSGVYECQISTTPPVGYTMIFSVVEPITSIPGGPELYIDLGSTVNLTCIVKHLPDPPLMVHWTHNNQEINYDSPRGGVSVITEKGDITTSYLLIQRAQISDSGKYTCLPSNANSKSVFVHILNGDHPAAVQKANFIEGLSLSPLIILTLIARI